MQTGDIGCDLQGTSHWFLDCLQDDVHVYMYLKFMVESGTEAKLHALVLYSLFCFRVCQKKTLVCLIRLRRPRRLG